MSVGANEDDINCEEIGASDVKMVSVPFVCVDDIEGGTQIGDGKGEIEGFLVEKDVANVASDGRNDLSLVGIKEFSAVKSSIGKVMGEFDDSTSDGLDWSLLKIFV